MINAAKAVVCQTGVQHFGRRAERLRVQKQQIILNALDKCWAATLSMNLHVLINWMASSEILCVSDTDLLSRVQAMTA